MKQYLNWHHFKSNQFWTYLIYKHYIILISTLIALILLYLFNARNYFGIFFIFLALFISMPAVGVLLENDQEKENK